MTGFRLQRLRQLMEPEPGNPQEVPFEPERLVATTRALLADDKGLLAMDESKPTFSRQQRNPDRLARW